MRLCLVDHMSCFEWFQETGKGISFLLCLICLLSFDTLVVHFVFGSLKSCLPLSMCVASSDSYVLCYLYLRFHIQSNSGSGRWSPCLMWKNELKNLWHVWRRPTLHCDPTANGPSLKTLMKFVPFKISFLSTTMVTIS
ncbi:hypothetical protein HA466_0177430 [Hirschfeldia incana]|nr:hypothetical protein HA466_0177430 [Hirschfeldia incana]